jgi:antitoxin component YwqK of YwqJK toxin-antitoxin module
MKYQSLKLFFLAALLPAASAFAVEECELNQQPVSPSNGATTEGKTGIMRCKDKESGALLREQELRNGRFMGVVRNYRDGKLIRDYTVNEKGNRDGVFREYSPEGQLLREENAQNGTTIGITRDFDKNGKLRRATYYGTGGPEQAYAEFTGSGQLRRLRCADKPVLGPAVDDAVLCGFKHGPSKLDYFNEKGELTAHVIFDEGKRLRFEEIGSNGKPEHLEEIAKDLRTERWFDQEGIRRKEVLSRLGGRIPVREREQEFSERGTLTSDKQWSAGLLSTEKTYYLNGQLRAEIHYSGDGNKILVQSKDYYDNGILAEEGSHQKIGYQQVPQGVHKSYNQQGKLVAETSYDERGRLKHEKAWDADGKLLRDDEVFEDGSRKSFAR